MHRNSSLEPGAELKRISDGAHGTILDLGWVQVQRLVWNIIFFIAQTTTTRGGEGRRLGVLGSIV